MTTPSTDTERALTTALQRMTEALNQATKEHADLIGFVARCRDSVPAGYAADFESGAIACPEDVASYVAAAFSEMVAERGALSLDLHTETAAVIALRAENAALRAELGDLPQAQADMLATIKRLKADVERYRKAAQMAVELIETNAHERRHVRWALIEAMKGTS